MARLIDTLESNRLGDRDVEDKRLWQLDEEKGFSVQSLYWAQDQSPPNSFPDRFIWNSRVPSKLFFFFFFWLLWWDKVQTVDHLVSKGMLRPNKCFMCHVAEETSGHLFIHCPIAGSLWENMLERFDAKWAALAL